MPRSYPGFLLMWAGASLSHRRLRTALTVTAIALATSLVVIVWGFSVGYARALADNVNKMGYHVLVTAKGCPYEAATLLLKGGVIPMYIDESHYRALAGEPEVAAVTRFFLQSATSAETGHLQLYMGVDENFRRIKPWVRFQRGGWFSGPEAREAILGYSAAEYLRRNLGDEIEVNGQRLRICGVFDRTGTQDDGTVFLPLATAQKIFDRMGKLTGLGIVLRDIATLDAFTDRIYDMPGVQVITLQQVQRTILNLVGTARVLTGAVALAGLIIAVFGIMNTVLMAVVERVPDLGIMRALGCRRWDVFALVWVDAAVLAVVGAAAGCGLSMALARGAEWMLREVLPYTPVGSVVALEPVVLGGSAGLIVGLGMVSGLFPAWRATVVPPLRSIRQLD